ncbi:hypothetical protein ASO20_01125 [Mycoplasma sp. (ex Biomphalaria glabrata)]|uniref:ATP-grasp domain-containing protein n=1 Tax=Mycoplasma sp. (ex Biomphalaria glabrata) TaxID=1749074 RepID=UPI00073AD714|nr:ATP-grasp domain-containing protein [Mycoplasma sp. (ex Biomphalaria glabrata)]ALV23260.1 hypothetical protein ASO20_01125 [Mycoplasma sp. (ex Biomphalaria glabrata)]
MKRVGIIGGGQLAMLMTLSLKYLDNKTHVIILDPNKKCSASFYADEIIVGQYGDEKKLSELFSKSDIVSYEFENIPINSLEIINQKNPKCLQTTTPLMISQNRILEKNLFRNLNIKTAGFHIINNSTNLKIYLNMTSYPCILKTTQLGYDGKGQVVIKNKDDINAIEKAIKLVETSECILEEFVDYVKEISVIGVYYNQKIQICAINENTHKNGILYSSKPFLDEVVNNKLKNYFKKITNKLPNSGILSIEFFLDKKGNLIANELAPRVHNSGHHTMLSMRYSQFDFISYILLNKSLPKQVFEHKAVMFNVLGQHYVKIKQLMENYPLNRNLDFVDYFKEETKYNRKMAHINILESEVEIIDKIKSILDKEG